MAVNGAGSANKAVLERYRESINKKVLFIVTFVVLLLFLVILSICVGAVHIPIGEVILALLGKSGEISHSIIYDIRLPRIFTAIVAGMGLAVAGAAMQSILRNPLGSPFTLGISHAAAFGAAFAVIVLGAGTVGSTTTDAVMLNNPYIVTISAFAGSLISTFVILLLAKLKSATPETMILAGVALGSLFMAGYTAMQYFATDTELATIVFWTFGDAGRTTWRDLGLMVGVTAPAVVYFTRKSWDYSVMDAGDESAKSLGINVGRLRLIGMLVAGLVTALTVSFCGIIGFVGLVVPHIVRKIIGGDEKFLIPASCLVGGALLLAADTAARTVIAPIVLPVGILTSFLGAPLFIYLVLRGRREYW